MEKQKSAAETFKEYFENVENGVSAKYGRQWAMSETLDHPLLSQCLPMMQASFNNAFANEEPGLPPFHLDYLRARSDVKDAIAFRHGGYSFIAITDQMMRELLQLSIQLSASSVVRAMLQIDDREECRALLSILMFVLITGFLTAHEFSHHKSGHCSDENTLNSFADERSWGSPSDSEQIDECIADSYAVGFVLDVFTGQLHRLVVDPFQKCAALNVTPDATQQKMYATLVITVAAYWLTRPPVKPSLETVYGLSHPLARARLKIFRAEASRWCEANRPHLNDFMTANFEKLIYGVSKAVGDNVEAVNDEAAFLRSPDGESYCRWLLSGVRKFTS